jgi:large conductance mechanosensitive channel
MAFLKEFKNFAMKGNVIDLAVGVIIGGAFQKIVDSIVKDLIMPLVGIFFKADFSNLYIPLSDKVAPNLPIEKAREAGPIFAWGNFVTVLLNFIILAFVIFWFVKLINSIRHKEESKPAAPPAPSIQEKLLMEIRDALKK